jgi:hypothetical protein
MGCLARSGPADRHASSIAHLGIVRVRPGVAGLVEGALMHIDRRLLGWGAFFILAGGIPLAVRAGVLEESLVGQWAQLWPLLLIGWGIGLLLRNSPGEWLGGAVVAVTFGIMAGGLLATGWRGFPLATGCTNDAPTTAFQARTGDLTSTAQVDVDFSCGSLSVSAADGSAWSLTGADRDGRGPKVTSSASQVSIKPDATVSFPTGGRSTWNLAIPRGPTVDLSLTLNAGDGTVDLGGAAVGSASLTLNAGKLDVNLASVAKAGDVSATVNAGAAAISLDANGRDVSLSLNAGSLQVCLPAGAPVRVNWSGTLGSNNFAAAGLKQTGDSTWTSSTFNELEPHAELHVSANAGSFEVRFGGTCRA